MLVKQQQRQRWKSPLRVLLCASSGGGNFAPLLSTRSCLSLKQVSLFMEVSAHSFTLSNFASNFILETKVTVHDANVVFERIILDRLFSLRPRSSISIASIVCAVPLLRSKQSRPTSTIIAFVDAANRGAIAQTYYCRRTMGPPEIDPPPVVPRPPQRVLPVKSTKSTASPVPIHIVDCTLSTLTQQHPSDRPPAHQTQLQPPPMSTSPLPSLGSNRHQLLLNRFGKPCYASVAEKKGQELQVRRHHVRDLREESERALEALIVDRRLLQREKVIEMTTATLDIDVGLQRMHFERELHVMHTHAALEQQRHTSRRRKLTRAFETTFVAQSGALMRRAARAAVASSLTTEEQEQHRLAAAVKVREAEAHERRCNAKSCWFVRNRMDSVRYFRAVEGEKAERNRLTGWRQWMKEDKDKKKMLRLM